MSDERDPRPRGSYGAGPEMEDSPRPGPEHHRGSPREGGSEDHVRAKMEQHSPGEGTPGDDKTGLGRTYVPWNSEEEEALRLGVMKHGIGAWQIILRDPDFAILTIRQRTGIQLKDKWRNLVKFNHLSREESVLAAKNSERKWKKQGRSGRPSDAGDGPPHKPEGGSRRPSDAGDGHPHKLEAGSSRDQEQRGGAHKTGRPEPHMMMASMPMPGNMGISSEAAARGLLGLQAQAYALGRLMPPADIENAARFAMMHGVGGAPPPARGMFEGGDPRAPAPDGRRMSWGGHGPGPGPGHPDRGFSEDGSRGWAGPGPGMHPGLYPPGHHPGSHRPSRGGEDHMEPPSGPPPRSGGRKRSISESEGGGPGPRGSDRSEREREQREREEQWRDSAAAFAGSNGYGAAAAAAAAAASRKPNGKPPHPSPYLEQAYLWQQWARWSEMQMGALVEVRMLLAESLQLQSEADNSLIDMVVRVRSGSHAPEQLQHSIQICEMANDKVQQTYKLMDAWRRRVCSDAALEEPNLSAIPALPRHLAGDPGPSAHQRHLEEIAQQRQYEAAAAAAVAAAASRK